MFSFLRQSTASQTRLVGPFVDDTDFKSAETALTINNTDVKLSKNGGASANKNSGGGTHIANGMYALTFDATDTGTVGELGFSILVSGALLVVGKFWVLEEAIYDSLYGANAAGFDGNQRVGVGNWLGTAVTANDIAIKTALAKTTHITGFNDLSAAAVNAEVDTALADIHLDHLLAATYDPAAKPGAADALLNELVEDDAGVSRFTANALEQAPTGGSAPTAAAIADAVWEEALADHSGTAGSTAEQLAAAGAGGDPWATAVPGAYGAGTAGKLVGDYLDATVSSRLAAAGYTAPDNASIAALAALLAELTEDDGGGNNRYTAKALEEAPGGGGLTLADIADAVLDEVVEAGAPANAQTLRQLVRLIVATVFGKSSLDEDGQTVRFRDLADSKDRVVGQIDSSGYRTAVDTLDGS